MKQLVGYFYSSNAWKTNRRSQSHAPRFSCMHVDVANKNPATVRLEGKHIGPSTPIYNAMITTFPFTFPVTKDFAEWSLLWTKSKYNTNLFDWKKPNIRPKRRGHCPYFFLGFLKWRDPLQHPRRIRAHKKILIN